MTRRLNTFGKRGGGGRRARERIASTANGQLVCLSSRQTAHVRDISAQGARVSVEIAPEVGAEVFLVLSSADLYGRVIWRIGSECGLRFDRDLDARDVARLGW